MMIPPALHAHLQSVFVVIILSHDGCLKGILSLLSWHAAVHGDSAPCTAKEMYTAGCYC
ncbi:hypothetical protein G3P88_004476 [Escherichia coli]|nr:hypothetical protein [Escherichia coli]